MLNMLGSFFLDNLLLILIISSIGITIFFSCFQAKKIATVVNDLIQFTKTEYQNFSESGKGVLNNSPLSVNINVITENEYIEKLYEDNILLGCEYLKREKFYIPKLGDDINE